MNNVQCTYTPPRLITLACGALTFAVYQLFRRPMLASDATQGEPVPLIVAVGMSLVIGYGVTMLGWLIKRTKGQVWLTFRPTRGRIIGAFCLAMVAPFWVLSYVPWIFGGLMVVILFDEPLWTFGFALAGMAVVYPLTAMIVRHTYERRMLGFGLFCLAFWTAYGGHLLFTGELVFNIQPPSDIAALRGSASSSTSSSPSPVP